MRMGTYIPHAFPNARLAVFYIIQFRCTMGKAGVSCISSQHTKNARSGFKKLHVFVKMGILVFGVKKWKNAVFKKRYFRHTLIPFASPYFGNYKGRY